MSSSSIIHCYASEQKTEYIKYCKQSFCELILFVNLLDKERREKKTNVNCRQITIVPYLHMASSYFPPWFLQKINNNFDGTSKPSFPVISMTNHLFN